MSRIVCAMSGGVDSSVAALLLQQQGHDVVGVTLTLVDSDWEAEEVPGRACCSWGAVQRARATCHRLGVPHYVLDFRKKFGETVIEDFLQNYDNALTPNPCLRCNEWIKFGALLDLATALGFELVATGHYARLEEREGRMTLRRGRDRTKDQSYALYGLSQHQLAHTSFPLGGLTKETVRRIAGSHGLPTAGIRDSQDLCFVPHGDYAGYFGRHRSSCPGPILDLNGEEVGRHAGLHKFTIGQRSGMRVSAPTRLYVVDLDPDRNAVIVGPREALPTRRCRLRQVNWVSLPPLPPGATVTGEAEVRYRSKPTPATLTATGEHTATVELPENETALAPGQSVVLYQGDVVVAGGIIDRPERFK